MSLITGITDSLVNFITGLGTQKDPRTSSRFCFRELDRNVLEQMYRSDWLARRLVDLPAEDATREWRQWQANGKVLERISQIEKKFEVQKKVRQGLTKGRLYGGSALVLGVDVGQPEDELDLDDVGLDDLKFVVVLNRYELSAGPRIYNVDSPYYTRPEYYTVSTPMYGFLGEGGGKTPGRPLLSDPGRRVQSDYGMVRVHPSRVIEFCGNELPDWRLAPMGGGWGDSVLQTIDDSLRDFAMITGGLASMINDMKMDVVRVPDLSRKLSNVDTSNKLIGRFTVANTAKSTINTLLLDKEEEWERISTTFGSTPELIAKAMTIACAAGGVPESRLMGSSPGKGLSGAGSSGGEVDIHNYYDDVKSKQKTQYTPQMTPLDRCIQQSATGRYDPSIEYEWNPLYQATPSEMAAIALQKAQTTQIYVGLSLINEDAMREATISQLTEDNVYPGLEDAIDEFGAEPEEPVEPEQPVPPAGMLPKGQFEPNPFAMLKAQTSGALPKPPTAGQPGAAGGGRPAIGARKGIGDFNPDHDEKTGRFIGKSSKKAHEAGLNAVAGITGVGGGWGDPVATKRSAAASAAAAKRKAHAAEPFPVKQGGSPHDVGMTAVSRVIAMEKGRGRTATKGEVSAAAKEDVKTAVETWAQTKGLKVPEGINGDELKTKYRMAVMMKQFITDPDTRKTIFSQISKNSVSWSQKAMADLPAHALSVAHHGIADMIADRFDEFVTDAVVGGIVTAATAVGGPVGGVLGTAVTVGLKSEIELGIDKMAERIGLTPEHIAGALHGIGHTLVSTYQRWKKAAGHAITGDLAAFSGAPHKGRVAHAHDEEPFDPIEQTLQLIAEALDERERAVNSGDNF